MLNNIRQASKGIWFRVFLGALAVMFALLWGVGDMLSQRGNSVQVILSVGKKQTSAQYFIQRVQREWMLWQQKVGKAIDFDVAKKAGIIDVLFGQVYTQLVERSLIELEADRLNIVVSDDMVRQFIQEQPQLMENGKYSRRRLNELLASMQISKIDFIEEVRSELKQHLLLRPLMMNLSIPNQIHGPLYGWALEERDIELVSTENVKLSVPLNKTPPEDSLINFFETNAHLYAIPETRHVDILVVDTQIVKTVPTTEERLAAFKKYKADGGDKTEKEIEPQLIREFKRIHGADTIFKTAGDIQDKLASGETLEEISAQYGLKIVSINNLKGGDHGAFPEQFDAEDKAELLKEIFDRNVGEIPAQHKTAQGDIVFARTTAITPQQQPALEAVRSQVSLDWVRKETYLRHQETVAKLFEEARQKPQVFETLWADHPKHRVNYRLLRSGVKGDKNPRYKPSEELLTKAFSTKKGDVFQVFIDGKIMIGRVIGINRPQTSLSGEGFAQFKGRVLQSYQNDFMSLYMKGLQKRYRVELNEALFESVKGSLQSGN